MNEVERFLRLKKECYECSAPGDNPCRDCCINTEINKILAKENFRNNYYERESY